MLPVAAKRSFSPCRRSTFVSIHSFVASTSNWYAVAFAALAAEAGGIDWVCALATPGPTARSIARAMRFDRLQNFMDSIDSPLLALHILWGMLRESRKQQLSAGWCGDLAIQSDVLCAD